MGEIRPEQGILLLRIPVNGTAVVEEARSLTDGSRIDSLSGYLLSDARDSVLAKTAYLPGGAPVVEAAEYDAWGATKAVDDPQANASFPAPVHQFTGVEPDPGTGLYHFGVRTYDPTLRRWLSPDPLLLASPDLDVKTGVELNLFQYASSNPVGKTDPGGMYPDGFPNRPSKPQSAERSKGEAFGLALGMMPIPGADVLAQLRVDWYKHQAFNADTAEWRAGVQAGLMQAGLIKISTGLAMMGGGAVVDIGAIAAAPESGGLTLTAVPGASAAVSAGQILVVSGMGTITIAASLGSGSVPSTPTPPAATAASGGSRFPEKPGQIQHIFRDAPGHVVDTAANRALLQGVADDASATLGTDKFGNVWSGRTLDDGTQAWVQTRNGVIQNGGGSTRRRRFSTRRLGCQGPRAPNGLKPRQRAEV